MPKYASTDDNETSDLPQGFMSVLIVTGLFLRILRICRKYLLWIEWLGEIITKVIYRGSVATFGWCSDIPTDVEIISAAITSVQNLWSRSPIFLRWSFENSFSTGIKSAKIWSFVRDRLPRGVIYNFWPGHLIFVVCCRAKSTSSSLHWGGIAIWASCDIVPCNILPTTLGETFRCIQCRSLLRITHTVLRVYPWVCQSLRSPLWHRLHSWSPSLLLAVQATFLLFGLGFHSCNRRGIRLTE